uniref:Uncharacterized protein n=1 Tax=Timema shepardi TaxID=629360 RepID=A0A7R9AYY7_TIMSH|nr:unnamed protein product [Timema shepardi]
MRQRSSSCFTAVLSLFYSDPPLVLQQSSPCLAAILPLSYSNPPIVLQQSSPCLAAILPLSYSDLFLFYSDPPLVLQQSSLFYSDTPLVLQQSSPYFTAILPLFYSDPPLRSVATVVKTVSHEQSHALHGENSVPSLTWQLNAGNYQAYQYSAIPVASFVGRQYILRQARVIGAWELTTTQRTPEAAARDVSSTLDK